MRKLVGICLLAAIFSGCASQEKLALNCGDKPEFKESCQNIQDQNRKPSSHPGFGRDRP